MTHNMPQQSGAQTPDDRRARIEAPLRIKLCLNSPRGEHRATNAHNIVRNGLHALLPQRKAANRFPLPKPTKAQAFARNAVCSLHGHAVQRHRPTPVEDVGINFSPKVERNAQRPSPAQATVWSERRTEAGNRQKKFGIGKTCGNCRRFTGVCRANDPLPAHFQNFEPSPGRIVLLLQRHTPPRPSNRSFSNAINPSHSASAIAARSRASRHAAREHRQLEHLFAFQ